MIGFVHRLSFAIIAWLPVFLPNTSAIAQPLASARPDSVESESAKRKALQFLLKMQSKDGAWRSRDYGNMKQGAAITSLVLYALSHLPDEDVPGFRSAIDRAAEFLKRGILRNRCVCNPDGSLDYSVYSTAMVLTAHKRIGIGLSGDDEQTLVDYLLSCQCDTQRGFKPANPNFGGWDILGPGATGGKTAGANVSVTFYVIEALEASKNPQVKPAIGKAKAWCQRILLSNEKGGFYFTSEPNSTLNKAGLSEQQIPRPYGTATCDGLGIMLLTGFSLQSAEVSTTIGWIKSHPSFSKVPGFETDDETGWKDGLRFYYLASLARSLNQIPGKHSKSKTSIRRTLEKLQKPDGSWQSLFTHMREDDKMIATPIALLALLLLK